VCDLGNYRVQKFDSSGSFLLTFGTNGPTAGKFNYPYGIAFDGSGNAWVADNNNNRVQEFNSSGTYITLLPVAFPGYIAIDASGNIWTTNNSTNQVTEINTSGSTLRTFGSAGSGNGQFNSVAGIAIH
jgi:DNA-binding beta-propeller fold protein YncE